MQSARFDIQGPVLFTSPVHGDDRGTFFEAYHAQEIRDLLGFDPGFVQDNVSHSKPAGTLRGLHLQRPPFAQGKFVRCITGSIRDVIVDVRDGSATFGQSLHVDLCAEDGRALWVPAGFLHGFVTQEANTIVTYKVTAHYDKNSDISVLWNDPDLDVDWGEIGGAPHLSEKDKNGLSFAAYQALIEDKS